MPHGPPYPPTVWALGGLPRASVDVPVTAVFLALFILGAIAHMTILQLNGRRGHKFLMSGLIFGPPLPPVDSLSLTHPEAFAWLGS
jgi:hypothetical protein